MNHHTFKKTPLFLNMNILAVGAHWDDIELGCGLTLKRLADNGHKIFSVVVCSSLYGKNENEGMSEEDALEFGTNSFKIIGATYLATPKQPNSKLTYNKEIMIALEELARECTHKSTRVRKVCLKQLKKLSKQISRSSFIDKLVKERERKKK